MSISQEYTLSTAAVALTHPSLRACLHSCFHGGRKLTPPLWLRLHPPRFSGSSAPTPLLLSQYMCSPSRSLWPIDRPLLKPPCVAVVHLPEVTPAMEFFVFPFTMCQPTSCFKLLYFLLAGGDSPYNIQRCSVEVKCRRCCQVAKYRRKGEFSFGFVKSL